MLDIPQCVSSKAFRISGEALLGAGYDMAHEMS